MLLHLQQKLKTLITRAHVVSTGSLLVSIFNPSGYNPDRGVSHFLLRRYAMNTQENLFLNWNTSDIYDAQAKYLVQEGEAESEDEAWIKATECPSLIDNEWSHLIETLTEKLNTINPTGYWHCQVKNFGWRSLSGSTQFEAEDAQTFLSSFLPDTDCTFNIYIDESKPVPEINIQNFHHDSPTGKEWYTIVATDAEALAA